MNQHLIIKWSLIFAVVMLLFPWMAVTWVPSNDGMSVCLLLLFVADPLCIIVSGIAGGRKLAEGWILPLLGSAFLLAGTWLFFELGEAAFVLYAFIDLLLGYAALLIRYFFSRPTA